MQAIDEKEFFVVNKLILSVLLGLMTFSASAVKLSAQWPSKYLNDCKGVAYAYATPNGTYFAVDDMAACSHIELDGEVHKMKKKKNGRYKFHTQVQGVRHITLFSNRNHNEAEIKLARNLFSHSGHDEVEVVEEVHVPSQQEKAMAYAERLRLCGEHFRSKSNMQQCVSALEGFPHAAAPSLAMCTDLNLSTRTRFACIDSLKQFGYKPFKIVKACHKAFLSSSSRQSCIRQAQAFDHNPEALLKQCKNQFMSTRDQLDCFQMKFAG